MDKMIGWAANALIFAKAVWGTDSHIPHHLGWILRVTCSAAEIGWAEGRVGDRRLNRAESAIAAGSVLLWGTGLRACLGEPRTRLGAVLSPRGKAGEGEIAVLASRMVSAQGRLPLDTGAALGDALDAHFAGAIAALARTSDYGGKRIEPGEATKAALEHFLDQPEYSSAKATWGFMESGGRVRP